MFRTLSIATVLAASLAAAPAFAETVKIKLTGKSSEAIAAEVSRAAAHICRDVSSYTTAQHARTACIRATIATTNAKIANIYASAPSSSVASN